MSTLEEYNIADDLIDRTEEFSMLMREIARVQKSQGTIICAYTGVGKTALSKKIINSISDIYSVVISVKTDPENIRTSIKEGKFLSDIFSKAVSIMDALPEKKKLSFSYFISHNKNKNLKKAKNERFLEDLFKSETKIGAFKVIIYYIVKRFFKFGEYNCDSYINEDKSTNIRIMNYYLQYLFSNVKIFLKIDNIQNVDEKSLACILGWMNEYKNMGHYFLFEYTLDKNNSFQKAIQLTEEFNDTGITITLRKLDFLQEDDALKVLKIAMPFRNFTIKDENAIKYYYSNIGCGNIRKLIDYDFDNSNRSSSFYDPTYEKLRMLDKEELYIASIIILCNGSVTTTFYEGIFCDDPLVKDKMKSLEILCEKKIEFSNLIMVK